MMEGAVQGFGLRILADENMPGVERAMASFGRVRRFSGRRIGHSQLREADVLLVRSVTTVDEQLLQDTPVRFVGSATSGIDHIDIRYLEDSGIQFAHAAGANANSVVEYVLSAMASVGESLERLMNGETCGIIGYGFVGMALAARLEALGINSRIYDPWLEYSNVPAAASLEEVLDCSVICLHPELTDKAPYPSRHLISRETLPLLRPDALLINASRGGVVDNRALLEHLDTGSDLLTVLDVWEGEPHINVPLLKKVTLATPHIAGYSLDSKIAATDMLARAMATKLGLASDCERYTAQGPAPLVIPYSVSGATLVRALIYARYDIREDDRRMRSEWSGGIGQHFDNLRKHYPQRRELAGSSVTLPVGSSDSRLVLALGCKPSWGEHNNE